MWACRGPCRKPVFDRYALSLQAPNLAAGGRLSPLARSPDSPSDHSSHFSGAACNCIRVAGLLSLEVGDVAILFLALFTHMSALSVAPGSQMVPEYW